MLGTSADGYAPGVEGTNSNASGQGVRGIATGAFGSGVVGLASGPTTRFAVEGQNAADDPAATTYGVYGFSNGKLPGDNGRSRGVYGYAQSARARGVYGYATGLVASPTDEACGVYGSGATNIYGVYSDGDLGASGTKAFLQPHPHDPSLAVRFVCLEGNEAGTYFRGTAQLVNGTAEIPIPESWRLCSADEQITVQVTAVGGPAVLFVAEKSRERIVVQGSPDVAFDYHVNGVRQGYETIETVLPNGFFRPDVRGVPYGRHLSEGIRRILVQNGTLNPDFTPNEATAARLGWELSDPEDPDTWVEHPWVQDYVQGPAPAPFGAHNR